MSVEIIDGATILNFVSDDAAFREAAERRFAALDIDGDGFVSFAEMVSEFRCLRVLELSDKIGFEEDDTESVYRSLFTWFNRDSGGAVGPEEYVAQTREMMMAIGHGFGFMPLQMVIGQDSLLMNAVQREA